MKQPTLVILAAGMGSRYGGLKQIDPVDERGHIIIDFSIYDAIRAGFEKIVFIIKQENHELFERVIGERVSKYAKVEYVFQDVADLPEGFAVPQGREKPWGTGHALLCCEQVIDGPFAVINADDYYGREAFEILYRHLTDERIDLNREALLVGYVLENTLSENGYVARGVCRVNEAGQLTDIEEITKIGWQDGRTVCSRDDGESWEPIDAQAVVSMNMWGFSADFIQVLKRRFVPFLETTAKLNPLKSEFFIPLEVGEWMKRGEGQVRVARSLDKWYGVTYREDKPMVMAAMRRLTDEGVYPEDFLR